jgi:ribosome assembly protein 1
VELRLTPLEAYWHLQQVLERVNAISSSLITNETFRLDETEAFADGMVMVGGWLLGEPSSLCCVAQMWCRDRRTNEPTTQPTALVLPLKSLSLLILTPQPSTSPQEWLFAPERGNVVFASSLYCWAFGVSTFARIWAGKLGVRRGLLQRHLWGDFVFNAKTLAVSRYSQETKAKPMFVAMVLDPIWQLYEATVLEQDLDKAAKMIKRLGLVRACVRA